MPKTTLCRNPYEKGDKLIEERLKGNVGTYGCGNRDAYTEKNFGLTHATYHRRIKSPGTIDLDTLRRIFEKCNFTDAEILRVFQRT